MEEMKVDQKKEVWGKGESEGEEGERERERDVTHFPKILYFVSR